MVRHGLGVGENRGSWTCCMQRQADFQSAFEVDVGRVLGVQDLVACLGFLAGVAQNQSRSVDVAFLVGEVEKIGEG